MRIVVFLVCLSISTLGVEFHLRGGIPFGYTPILDGYMERTWRNSLEFRMGREMVSLRLMRNDYSLFLLVEFSRDSSDYIGESRYMDVFSGADCWRDGSLLRIPFKFWRGRAYVFTVKDGIRRLVGFSGVGLGRYLELSIPVPDLNIWKVCMRLLNSRTLDVLESHELVVYSVENTRTGGP